MSDNSDKNTQKPDLSALTDFQFGPNWARAKEDAPRKEYSSPREDFGKRSGPGKFRPRSENAPFGRDRKNDRERSFGKPGGDRDFRGERKFDRSNRFDRNDRNDRNSRPERQERQPVEPTPGIRAEIRPVDAGLGSIANEIHKYKRCYSLYDLAKLFMGGRDRYEIWYIREENGPDLISCTKAPAVWLSRQEALASLWQSPWFADFYEEVIEEVEAPKGQFNAIARCGMSETLIGPVNWHGYQTALAQLHAERFASMPFERFKSRVIIDRSEEAVAQWLESATKRSVWKSKREDAQTLQNRREVEEDFQSNHFDEVFETTGKCHVLGTIASRSLSHGLFAHLLKLVETARRHPAQIIPNVCHGLARHHLPIFKWNNGHHTGPSRPHTLPSDTKLAERPSAIVEWIQNHAGEKIEAMLAELAPAPAPENAPAPAETATEETEAPAPAETQAAIETPAPAAPVEEAVAETEETIAPVEETASPDVQEETPAAEQPQAETAEQPQPEPIVKTAPTMRDLWLADLMWLQQQGFVLVTKDSRVYFPKSEATPHKTREKKAKKGKPSGKTAPAPRDKKPKKDDSVKPQEEELKTPAPAKETDAPAAADTAVAKPSENIQETPAAPAAAPIAEETPQTVETAEEAPAPAPVEEEQKDSAE